MAPEEGVCHASVHQGLDQSRNLTPDSTSSMVDCISPTVHLYAKPDQLGTPVDLDPDVFYLVDAPRQTNVSVSVCLWQAASIWKLYTYSLRRGVTIASVF